MPGHAVTCQIMFIAATSLHSEIYPGYEVILSAF